MNKIPIQRDYNPKKSLLSRKRRVFQKVQCKKKSYPAYVLDGEKAFLNSGCKQHTQIIPLCKMCMKKKTIYKRILNHRFIKVEL